MKWQLSTLNETVTETETYHQSTTLNYKSEYNILMFVWYIFFSCHLKKKTFDMCVCRCVQILFIHNQKFYFNLPVNHINVFLIFFFLLLLHSFFFFVHLFIYSIKILVMAQNEHDKHTLGIKHWNWKKNFILIVIWHVVVVLKLPIH